MVMLADHHSRQQRHDQSARASGAAWHPACRCEGLGQAAAHDQGEGHHRRAQQHGRRASPRRPDAPASARWTAQQPTRPETRIATCWVASWQRDIETAFCRRRSFQQEGGGGSHFAAQGEALQQTEEHRQHRRRDADAGIGRRQRQADNATGPSARTKTAWRACARCGRPDGRSPAPPSGRVRKPDPEGGQGQQQAAGRVLAGKKGRLRSGRRKSRRSGNRRIPGHCRPPRPPVAAG